jgi:hypothetical protein
VVWLSVSGQYRDFSVVSAVLLRPLLPYQDSQRLLILWEKCRKWKLRRVSNFMDWRDQNSVFESIAASRRDSFNLTGSGDRAASGRMVSFHFSNLASSAVSRPRFSCGRGSRRNPVVILTYGLWQRDSVEI